MRGALTIVVGTLAVHVLAAAPTSITRLTLASGQAQRIVALAIEGARRRVEDPACQRVFTDFTDRAGRTLWANLQALHRRPAEYLLELWFIDGNERSCSTVAAYTTPGSRVINICGSSFTNRSLGLQGERGEMIIIHELLHSLGLGENPPTSTQITDRVTERCGG